jgi:hypothetical protein
VAGNRHWPSALTEAASNFPSLDFNTREYVVVKSGSGKKTMNQTLKITNKKKTKMYRFLFFTDTEMRFKAMLF